jgi:ring-1,2-phenylacetyl-CoA epoxidase subunit PaaC
MSFDDAYEALTDHDDDARWAYGTGFSDPMAGVPTEVPDAVDRGDLAAYCLMLGDDALILSHRLQQWVTRAPELEDELAIANIGLDLLGQARLLLTRAGEVEASEVGPGEVGPGEGGPGEGGAGEVGAGEVGAGGRSEDALAYLRDPGEFRHVALAEREDADFAHLVARLLVFATWRLALLDRLAGSRDPVLAAIAAKGVKEVTYHREYAAQWVVRLGDGTELSHERMQAGLDAVWPLVAELFRPHEIEARLAAAGVAVDPSELHGEFDTIVGQVLEAATLRHPDRGAGASGGADVNGGGAVGGSGAAVRADANGADVVSGSRASGGADVNGVDVVGGSGAPGGRDGVHGGELVAILDEMQGLARAMPGSTW